MSASSASSLETRQVATVRVRRMRAARGACWVIVIGLLAVVGVTLLDALVNLPQWTRGLALAFWVTGVGVLAWRLVFRAWRDEPIPQPTREARRELPVNLRAAAAAAMVLGTCLLAGAFVPGAVDQLRRVAAPWHRAATSPYRVVVTSNNPVVRRGGTVTLTAYATKADASPVTALTATVVCRDAVDAPERSFPMTGDGNAAFHFTRVVSSDFQYRIEAGGATSDWFTVSAIDAIELAEGTTTEILPPKYVAGATKIVRQGFGPLDGLQHSTAEFRFRFTRTPKAAWLEFRAEGASPETRPVTLSDEGPTGTATFRMKQDGTLKLVIVVDQNGRELRLDDLAVSVRVKPDTPPRFEQVAGLSPRPMTANPGEKLTLAITATDDIAVAAAALEYAVGAGEGPSVVVPIPLTGTGTAKARGQLVFDLANRAKIGDTLRLRLRLFDSRKLDDIGLKPQEATYPESGWVTLRVEANSSPHDVQEIQGRREYVQAALERALKEVREEVLPAVDRVIEDAEKQTLPPEQVFRLNNSRDSSKTAIGLLLDAARENALCPELRPLAAALRSVADGLKEADESLRQAAIVSSLERGQLLTASRKLFLEAGERIESALTRNNQLARDRLALRAVAELAAEQASLNMRAATAPAAEVAKQQQELLAKFDALLRENIPLRTAIEIAKQQEFGRLAARFTDSAEAIHEFNEAVQRFHADAKTQAFAAIVADQKELAEKIAGLLASLDTPARLANVALPKAEEFRHVAELIADGKSVQALVEMAQLALTLEGVAATFEKFAIERLDSKAAAKQLALWQDDLRNRFRMATAATPTNFATLPAAIRASFRAEQAAIRTAAATLRVAAGESATARDAAVEHITNVSNFLNGTGANAERAMEIAVEQLNRLTAKLLTVPERLAKTRPEFEKLFREQESIQVGVEAVLRNTDAAAIPAKLAPFAARQRRQIAAFAVMDLPGFDARQVRSLAALTAATNDLQAGLAQDTPASQAWAKRELDRWRSILVDNVPPPDDKADELARRMEEAVRSLQATGATPAIAATVQDVSKQLGKFARLPEAAALQFDAMESTRSADLAFRNSTKPADLLRKVRLATDDLVRLADRLNGAESDLDRVRRLGANRRLGAARAKEVPPNSPVNAEVGRELGRELEELTLTRVGNVAQLPKQRLLAEYTRLRDKPGADRQAGAHAALATSLDELAALMADIDELTLAFKRTPAPIEPVEADAYLPTKPLADLVREWAIRLRTNRERIANLPAELAKWTKPAKTNPLESVEKSQRAFAAEVAKLAEGLAAFVGKLPTDPGFAESEAYLMADRLRNGSVREAKENGERVVRLLRKLAGSEHVKGAKELAEKQDRILAELAKVATQPGAIAACQRARSEELAQVADDLVKTLAASARDVGLESAVSQPLLDAATTAGGTAKLLREADTKQNAGKAEDASSLREDAESQMRVAATKLSVAGPMLTTIDAETVTLGETLRRVELAMRNATQEVGAAKQMRMVVDGLHQAAKVLRDRVANDGK